MSKFPFVATELTQVVLLAHHRPKESHNIRKSVTIPNQNRLEKLTRTKVLKSTSNLSTRPRFFSTVDTFPVTEHFLTFP